MWASWTLSINTDMLERQSSVHNSKIRKWQQWLYYFKRVVNFDSKDVSLLTHTHNFFYSIGNTPAFTNLAGTASVLWTEAVGYGPVFTVLASDADAGDTLTFSLTSESISGLFSLNSSSGWWLPLLNKVIAIYYPKEFLAVSRSWSTSKFVCLHNWHRWNHSLWWPPGPDYNTMW